MSIVRFEDTPHSPNINLIGISFIPISSLLPYISKRETIVIVKYRVRDEIIQRQVNVKPEKTILQLTQVNVISMFTLIRMNVAYNVSTK